MLVTCSRAARCRKADAGQTGSESRVNQLSTLVFRSLLGMALSFGAVANASVVLKVGAARVDITPPADPAKSPTGKYEHEKLYIRAIVLDNGSARAALIGADQSGLSEQVWTLASKQIAAELDCPVANILMSATHTHS